MTPLPPESTARSYFTYLVAGQNHTLTARGDGAASDATVSAHFSAFVDAMDAMVYASTFVKLERSELGSNVRVPATYTGTEEWGTGAADPDEAPLFYSFTGKDIFGRRVRVELFGRGRAAGDNWRVFAVDDSSIQAALDELRSVGAFWNTISDVSAIWNSYANKSVSQHWVKELR